MAESEEQEQIEIPCFNFVKIALIGSNIQSLFICFIASAYLLVSDFAYKWFNFLNPDEEKGPDTLTMILHLGFPGDFNDTTVLMKLMLGALFLATYVWSLSLYGVIKENKRIVLTFLILSIAHLILALVALNILHIILGVIWSLLYLVYYLMLVKRGYAVRNENPTEP